MSADLPPDREWTDPTVYSPYRVRIETAAGEVRSYPAHFVTLTPEFVFALDPSGRSFRVEPRSLRHVDITVQEPPEDYATLRAEYPNAYARWDFYSPTILRDLHESWITLGQGVRSAGRPAAHLIAKAPEHGYDLSHLRDVELEPAPPRDALTELHTRHTTEHDYLIFTSYPSVRDPAEVMIRHGLHSSDAYRIGGWGFAARLTGLQLEPLPKDPDVIRIERDDLRLAPHLKADNPVEGQYMIAVRPSTDPLTVATRNGVAPDGLHVFIDTFSATLTDHQLLDLRRDPDVTSIEDNAIITLDD